MLRIFTFIRENLIVGVALSGTIKPQNMDLNNEHDRGLSEAQEIILERIKKAITGLTIKEAKQVLYFALNELDEQAIVYKTT